MKKYLITYSDHITKGTRERTVIAETKAKAKKKFNDMWNNPYPILSIEFIKEGEK